MEELDNHQQEDVTLLPNQKCIATESFDGDQAGDLSFEVSEYITIVRPSEMMYWYIGRNEKGDVGTVPRTYLEPLEMEQPPPKLPPKPAKTTLSKTGSYDDDYQKMRPGIDTPILPPKAQKPLREDELEIMKLMEKERQKRYSKGTLVVATATYRAQNPQDLSFNVHEEMVIINSMPDLCWYQAHKAGNPRQRGVIPITHVRLVYMSDDEDEDNYQTPTLPGHDRIYDDLNDFISNSGWFSYPNIPLGKEAQLNCLAKKAGIPFEDFMSTKQAIYMFKYREEKLYIGKAEVLFEELLKHFECFGKRRTEIREIDDELCHHTDISGWELKVWVINTNEDIEVEYGKKVIEYDALTSPSGIGINEHMTFTSMDTFDTFWEWLSPN